MCGVVRGCCILFIAVVGVLRGSMSVYAQMPDVQAGRTSVDSFSKIWEDSVINTSRLLNDEMRRGGPCQEMLSGIHARQTEMLQSAQRLAMEMNGLMDQIQPITDVQAEVRKQRQELATLQQTHAQLMGQVQATEQELSSIRQSQQAAMARWLIDNYGAQMGPPIRITSPEETVEIRNTLFGALIVTAPRKLQIPESSQTTVQFTPALFTGDLFAQHIHLGPVGTTIQTPKGFEFKPGNVTDSHGSRPFQMQESEQIVIDGQTPVMWHWSTNATDEFQGAKFDIQMGARLDDPIQGAISRQLQLPVEVQYDPRKPFAEKYASIIGAFISTFIGGTISGVVATRLMYKSKTIDREDKAKEKAAAEAKAAEKQRPKLVLPDE